MYLVPPVGEPSQGADLIPKGFRYLFEMPVGTVIDYKRLLFQIVVLFLFSASMMLSCRGTFSPSLNRGRLLMGLITLVAGGGVLSFYLLLAPVEFPQEGKKWVPRFESYGNGSLLVTEDMKFIALVALLLGVGVYLVITAIGTRSSGTDPSAIRSRGLEPSA